jgi:hypothetical protein
MTGVNHLGDLGVDFKEIRDEDMSRIDLVENRDELGALLKMEEGNFLTS